MSRIRVLLVEDGTTARDGVAALCGHDGIDIVAASDETAAVKLAADLKPDVAVLDFTGPSPAGAAVAARLREQAPTVRVLVRSPQEDRTFMKRVMECGAKGYVVKRAAGDALAEAVQAVATGRTYIDPALAGPAQPAGTGQPLSAREEQVLRLLALGHVNKEVAAALDVSVKTVETHKFRGMAKLGLHSRVDLVRYAHQHGWFDDA
jgi:DNA-binding NarL/FixJ family response regulator